MIGDANGVSERIDPHPFFPVALGGLLGAER